jgi:hypothetical protein
LSSKISTDSLAVGGLVFSACIISLWSLSGASDARHSDKGQSNSVT